MKKLKLATVMAVGGCQHDALVALLKEMGHEIEAPNPGVRVRAGQRAYIRVLNTECTIAPQGTHPSDDFDTYFSYWDNDGNLSYEKFKYLLTASDGDKVIGYEK